MKRSDLLRPTPDPAPITTIAWRMAHLTASAVGARVEGLFGGPPAGYDGFTFAGTGHEALAQLDDVYAA